MGCCISTLSCSSRSTEESVSSSIPNWIFTNGKSRTACIFTQQGGKGVNQDAVIVWEDFMSEDVSFCGVFDGRGVFDGHGPHGHLVAHKVRESLPLKLLSSLKSCNSKQNGSTTTTCFNWNLKSNGQDSKADYSIMDKVNSRWRKAFLKAYKAMDKELRSHRNLDSFCSGSTAVTLVKQGTNLFMGSIGDSRAILASQESSGSMVAIQLTVDLKPDLPREAERITRCKGRVFSLEDEPGVSRVWMPNDNAPGLAMARAFGDFCLKKYGVISIPEFSQRVLTERDKFIVLASDGVWDVFSNDEVVEIVSSAPSRSSAARLLVNSAVQKWKYKYPTSKIDDCTALCLYLDGKMDLESDCQEQRFSSATLHSNHSSNTGESDIVQSTEPSLRRNKTVRSAEENGESELCEEEKWLGLEGLTRVNSLVKLPRFSEENMKT